MSSLESKIDLINHHFASCSKCKGNADDTCHFLADSGASLNFTNNLNDFSEYNEIKDGPRVQAASKDNQLQMCSMGAVFLTYEVVEHGKQVEKISHLNPVFYIPGLSVMWQVVDTWQNALAQ